jgi:hypothetical protein
MNCELFRDALVSDDPKERAEAERHAASCQGCSELLEDDRELALEVAGWKAAAPAPPPGLEFRIASAISAEGAPKVVPIRPRLQRLRQPVWLTAAAALVLIAFAWIGKDFLFGPAGSEFEQAIAQAEKSRTDYAQAIAELERSAQPILARAADPDLPPEQAALLLSFRDRLTHLDGVIAEVQGFLDEYPGHAGGNTALLAAYTEKQEVLGKLLELNLGETS